jgi:hypothetical protein
MADFKSIPLYGYLGILAVAFIAVSLLVIMTGGHPRWIRYKLALGASILSISAILPGCDVQSLLPEKQKPMCYMPVVCDSVYPLLSESVLFDDSSGGDSGFRISGGQATLITGEVSCDGPRSGYCFFLHKMDPYSGDHVLNGDLYFYSADEYPGSADRRFHITIPESIDPGRYDLVFYYYGDLPSDETPTGENSRLLARYTLTIED